MQLSIILPFFNEENYLERCIRSLEGQDIPMSDFEVICVNDGSHDRSAETVTRLMIEFDNIVLINQENQGVARARNNGINKAQGKYLLFIDADDHFVEDCFRGLLHNAYFYKAQVYILGFTVKYEDGTLYNEVLYRKYAGRLYAGIEAYFKARGDANLVPDRMLGILFERDFFNMHELRYLPDVPYLEDGEFLSRIFCLAERCIFNEDSILQGTLRIGSASSARNFHSEKAKRGFLLATGNLKSFQMHQILNKNQKEFINQAICKFVILVINSEQKPFSFRKIGFARTNLADLGLRKLDLTSVEGEFSTLGALYNRSVYLLLIYQFFMNHLEDIRLRLKKLKV